MENKTVQPWIAVNGYMNDEFRASVITRALEYLPSAPKVLRSAARSILNEHIKIPGFRTVTRAPMEILHRNVLEAFQEKNAVTNVVMFLWADAEEVVINAIEQAAIDSGSFSSTDWDMEKAASGYYPFEDNPEWDNFCDKYIEENPSIDPNIFRLASLWVTNLVSDEPATERVKDLEPDKPIEEDEHSDSEIQPAMKKNLPPEKLDQDKPEPEETLQSEVPMFDGSLEEMISILESHLEDIKGVQDQASNKVNEILKQVESADIDGSEDGLEDLQDLFQSWRNNIDSLELWIYSCSARIAVEFEIRNDLESLKVLNDLLINKEITNQVEDNARLMLKALNEIFEYDQEKQSKLEDFYTTNSKILALSDEISILTSDDSEMNFELTQSEIALDEMTLAEIKLLLKKNDQEISKLTDYLSQVADISHNRILSLVDQLLELEVSPDTIINGDISLGSVKKQLLNELPSKRLHTLEQQLVDLLNEQKILSQQLAPEILASDLLEDWDEDKLLNLLERLGKEQRDFEATLLLLSANKTHPRAESLQFSASIVSSQLRGFGQLSSKERPFELLANLSPIFLRDWIVEDEYAKAELCLVMLAARYGSSYRLPAEILWQVAYEWPIKKMKNWSKLWEAEVSDESISIITSSQTEQEDRLAEARSTAKESFKQDHGKYVKISLVKSKEHHTFLNNELVPQFEEYLNGIINIEEQLNQASDQKTSSSLSTLDDLIDDLGKTLHEDQIVQLYFEGINSHNIDDSDSIPQRACLRILGEQGKSILDYAHALLEFWQWQNEVEAGVAFDSLLVELEELSNLSTFATAALDNLVLTHTQDLGEWEEQQAIVNGNQIIEYELLDRNTYALRLPIIVGYLTGERIAWEEILPLMLLNLTEQINHDNSARLLLEREAPNQVLLLSQHIPVEIQKQAQSLKREKESNVDQLLVELMKLGGTADDLIQKRDLGRWGLIINKLNERSENLKAEEGIKTQEIRTEIQALRLRIIELDDDIFEMKDDIPSEVYDLIVDGLNLSRKHCDKIEYVDHINTYLVELRYRYEHKSWPFEDIRHAVETLHGKVESGLSVKQTDIDAIRILELFERNELSQMGLTPIDISGASLGTRIDLLRNWLKLKSVKGFMSDDLKVNDIYIIRNVFRFFAKMVAMKRTLNPEGQPITYDHPVIFSYMDLQYPKTAVLENHCVFIALPGEPPTAEFINQLNLIIDDREWLDYFFVFLFIPGCTQKLYQRLHSSYRKRGMVIIDESTLIQIILAEKDSQNPLGKLRPIMLNSLEADNVDVFKINQLVDTQASIFVGREPEIERITSSGDNYAVYGGRRIGKSSVLLAVEKLLMRRGTQVVSYSFEGQKNCSDDPSSVYLAQHLNLPTQVMGCEDFKYALQTYLESRSDSQLVILLDEVDRYIIANPDRHILIETLRSLSDRYGSQFRVIISGAMELYYCLNGDGPYTPASDPWRRMLNDIGPLKNLRPSKAEGIVHEGFLDILGWQFETRAIPQRIVELTGGHPAFVQKFCLKLQERAGKRGDNLIKLDDVDKVFLDREPERSFIAYVGDTLDMNLDPVGHYLILMLALDSRKAHSFTYDEIKSYATFEGKAIPEKILERSLEQLKVTSVVRENPSRVYEFSVPDYPDILIELGDHAHMEKLENEVREQLSKGGNGKK